MKKDPTGLFFILGERGKGKGEKGKGKGTVGNDLCVVPYSSYRNYIVAKPHNNYSLFCH